MYLTSSEEEAQGEERAHTTPSEVFFFFEAFFFCMKTWEDLISALGAQTSAETHKGPGALDHCWLLPRPLKTGNRASQPAFLPLK
jgi:hypothetical protein